jgi:UDPglucose 6-dehydrogenase
MKLSIIGTGHVGLITGACFAEYGHDVLCVDNNEEKIVMLNEGRMPIYEPGLEELVLKHVQAGRLSFTTRIERAVEETEVLFLCLPTPPQEDGSADLSFIEMVSRKVAEHLTDYRVIVEKSTVPVNTAAQVRRTIERYVKDDIEFDVVSNPEFLREGSAVPDTLNPDRIVYGTDSDRARDVMREVYKGFEAPKIETTLASSELIKHASNSFLAMKISYINAVAAVCELSGGDVQEVARGMGMDDRIGPRFLNAGIGYGGSCFPKDVQAFAYISRELGYPFPMLEEVHRVNQEARVRFVRRMEEELWILKDKTIAVLGLSFKPNTDDIRESASIEIIQALLEKGARVRATDPEAIPKARAVLGDKIEYVDDPYVAAEGADAVLLATEWEPYRNLDLEKLSSAMQHPTFLDGRNVYDPATMAEAGFHYLCVGRASRKPVPGKVTT